MNLPLLFDKGHLCRHADVMGLGRSTLTSVLQLVLHRETISSNRQPVARHQHGLRDAVAVDECAEATSNVGNTYPAIVSLDDALEVSCVSIVQTDIGSVAPTNDRRLIVQHDLRVRTGEFDFHRGPPSPGNQERFAESLRAARWKSQSKTSTTRSLGLATQAVPTQPLGGPLRKERQGVYGGPS